jgi:hypothetical protein
MDCKHHNPRQSGPLIIKIILKSIEASAAIYYGCVVFLSFLILQLSCTLHQHIQEVDLNMKNGYLQTYSS